MFVLQHFQQEVSFFDMFRCLSYFQPISDVGSYFHLCSAFYKNISAISRDF